MSPFPPADLSTWLRTDQGILLSMQNEVDSWTDQVNGDVWDAPTKQSQPTLFTGAQGIDGLRFYGGQYFVAPATLSSDAFTAVFVVQRLDTDREGPLAGSSNAIGAANEIAFGSTDTTIRVESASAGVSFSATVLPTTELTVITIRAGAGTFEFFQGDTLTASAPITGTGPFMFDQIGSFQTLRGLRGDLYELMVWPRRLTDAERAVVTSMLETKFGL